ncbi:transglycosylase domain-containing protein [Nonomuraea sp. NPDC050310]|uniref:transglycosylase domain-containing protein n=1 Tax=Nonomuraea sp. NPDC050310 TaxID=3154935 RepID=UPI0033C7AA35
MGTWGKRDDSARGALAKLATAALTGGVLVAALALPTVGGGGVIVKAALEDLDLRPVKLVEPPLAEKITLLDKNGEQFAQFFDQNRTSVGLDQVAEEMKTAIVAIEDYRFYEHGAIDLEGTMRALAKNVAKGGVDQGGSTITQQYVKQVLVNSAKTDAELKAAIETTVGRKLKELRYALYVEQTYTKPQILEKYLNIAYYGAGAYGVQAAARRFFAKNAADLDLAEAATLAGAVQSPGVTDPSRGKQARARLLERRNTVLDRMAELGKITPAAAAAAKKRPLGYLGKTYTQGCEQSRYPYFCLYVRHEILNDPKLGERAFTSGGLTVKTTLDPKMQQAADRAIRQYVSRKDKPVAAEAMVVPGTGAITAMAASRPFGSDAAKNEIGYNLVGDSRHGGGAGFQAGSTFKVFTLIAALEQGMRFGDGNTTGAAYHAPSASAFRDCKGNAVGDPSHPVRNSSEGGGGFKTLQTGTWSSVNTFFLALEEKVGLCQTVKVAEKLGIKRADGKPVRQFETFTLGADEMDPVTVAAAYAALGARGRYCRPMAILEIRDDRSGKVVKNRPSCRQNIEPEVADAVNDILSGVFTKGTMSGVGGLGRDAAGKTGTTDNYTAAWFAGYTPDLAAAVSLGDPRGAFSHDLIGVTIGGRPYGYVQGATISGPIWKQSMLGALAGTPATSFTPPDLQRFGGCSTGCAPRQPERDQSPPSDGEDTVDFGDFFGR